MNTLDLLSEAFGPLTGQRILDVGCGDGHLARSLNARGACVVGVNPSEESLDRARQVANEAQFGCAAAQALPFADGSFDGAVFLNSFHHVESQFMPKALDEAARVTVSGGHVIVVEPLPEGSFFEAFRLIEDETVVRAQAQDALRTALLGGRLRQLASRTIARVERFDRLEDFIARAAAADPNRKYVISAKRAEVEAAFLSKAAKEADLYRLEQPLKVDILKVA